MRWEKRQQRLERLVHKQDRLILGFGVSCINCLKVPKSSLEFGQQGFRTGTPI